MNPLAIVVPRVALVALALAATLPAMAAGALVPGTANLNLAGRDAGYTCCSGDGLAGQSPTQVAGLALVAGQALRIAAHGEVSYFGGAGAGDNPDGSAYNGVPYDYGDGITAPLNVNRVDALLGLFLGAASPTGGASPVAMDFSGGLGFTSLIMCTSNLPDKVALAVDTQVDDGIPAAGQVRGQIQTAPSPATLAAPNVSTYVETGINTYLLCKNL